MIKEKMYYLIKFKLESPLSIGNGVAELTDHDLIRDSKGIPFIPATSLAGVFSHYLEKEYKGIFAPSKNDEKILSPFFISDAELINSTGTSIRNGVKVKEDKTTEDGAKFDIEILEQGAEFQFRIEVTVRDDNDNETMEKVVDILIANLNCGNILLGMKSTRGFGKVSIEKVLRKTFTAKQLDEMIAFDKYDGKQYDDDYKIKTELEGDKFDILTVKLKQLGGISIRSYIAQKGEVDFEHIKSNGTPVIPGTSWNGMILKQVKYYNKLICDETKTTYNLDNWFGYVENKKARASSVIVEESKIDNSKELTITRNKIDRFSGGATDTALFNEKACFNGDTSLTIKVKKEITIDDKKYKNNYVLGLIGLVIKDISNGLIALGGQTSIGRGVFEVEGLFLNGVEQESEDKIISNMKIKENGGVANGN